MHITRVLKRQLLSRHLVHNAFAVIVTESTAQFIIVHLRLVLSPSPELRNLLGLEDPEFVAITGPLDQVLFVGREQKIEEELPELDGTTTCRNCGREGQGGEGWFQL